MDEATYESLRREIEAGRIAEIGGRTAASVEELDWLKGIGAKEDGSTDVETTAATHTLTQEQLGAVIDAATASRDGQITSLEDEAETLNVKIDGLQASLQRALADSAAKDATVTALQATVDTQRGQIETQQTLIAARQAQIAAQQQRIDDLTAAVAPAAQAPTAQTPAAQAPTAQTPAAQAPTAQTPAAQAPVGDKAADAAAKAAKAA